MLGSVVVHVVDREELGLGYVAASRAGTPASIGGYYLGFDSAATLLVGVETLLTKNSASGSLTAGVNRAHTTFTRLLSGACSVVDALLTAYVARRSRNPRMVAARGPSIHLFTLKMQSLMPVSALRYVMPSAFIAGRST